MGFPWWFLKTNLPFDEHFMMVLKFFIEFKDVLPIIELKL
jgi:hypothetical protein